VDGLATLRNHAPLRKWATPAEIERILGISQSATRKAARDLGIGKWSSFGTTGVEVFLVKDETILPVLERARALDAAERLAPEPSPGLLDSLDREWPGWHMIPKK
jgi:hypothetical protein